MYIVYCIDCEITTRLQVSVHFKTKSFKYHILKAGIDTLCSLHVHVQYLSSKATVGDIKWSHSRRVDCVQYCFHQLMQAGKVNHYSKPH